MPAAVVGGVIAGAGAIGGAALSSKAQSKAAETAAQAQQDTAAQNNALQQQIYNQNKATLSPFVNTGTQASSAINALLGLGGPAPTVGAPTDQQQPRVMPWNALYDTVDGAGRYAPRTIGYQLPGVISGYGGGTFNLDGTQATPVQPQQTYQNAFDNYRNSTGYQFRLGEGQRSLDNSYASRGVGQSGAAAKAALQYGQNIASGEFGNYLNALMAQQGVGLSAAGAQAGVSTGYANAVSGNNQVAADAIANGALLKGQANAGLYAGIGNALGNVGGAIFNSSFSNPYAASNRVIAANPGIF